MMQKIKEPVVGSPGISSAPRYSSIPTFIRLHVVILAFEEHPGLAKTIASVLGDPAICSVTLLALAKFKFGLTRQVPLSDRVDTRFFDVVPTWRELIDVITANCGDGYVLFLAPGESLYNDTWRALSLITKHGEGLQADVSVGGWLQVRAGEPMKLWYPPSEMPSLRFAVDAIHGDIPLSCLLLSVKWLDKVKHHLPEIAVFDQLPFAQVLSMYPSLVRDCDLVPLEGILVARNSGLEDMDERPDCYSVSAEHIDISLPVDSTHLPLAEEEALLGAMHLRWACEAFSAHAYDMAHAHLRRAIRYNRRYIDDQAQQLLRVLVRQALSQRDPGAWLDHFFSHLPPEFAWLTMHHERMIGISCLWRAILEAIWGFEDRSVFSFEKAYSYHFQVDQSWLQEWLDLLLWLDRVEALESRTVNFLLDRLEPVTHPSELAWFGGVLHANRGFHALRRDSTHTALRSVINAWRCHPQFLTNQGLWAVLFHMLRRLISSWFSARERVL